MSAGGKAFKDSGVVPQSLIAKVVRKGVNITKNESDLFSRIFKTGSWKLRAAAGAGTGAIAGAVIPEKDPKVIEGMLWGALAGLLLLPKGKKSLPR